MTGVELCNTCGDSGIESGTGRTNTGSKLSTKAFSVVRAIRKLLAHRIASQRISIQDAQFEMITSPALGFHCSGNLGPRLKLKLRSEIDEQRDQYTCVFD